ncbi:MAG: hypothetical protein AAFV80_20315, partial [Bacteroidota bacterium]
RVNKKNWLTFGVLQSFTISGTARKYTQPSFRWRHKLSKQWNIYVSYAPTFSYTAGRPSRFSQRIRGEIRNTQRFGNWQWRNSLNAEYHFPQRSKFSYRFFHTMQLTYRDKDWPIDVRPFVQTRLYYYLGGKPTDFEDPETEEVIVAAPNGFHGFRYIAGLRFRINKSLAMTVSYLNHREFNTSLFGGNPLNTIDASNGRLRNQFFNFQSIGIGLSIRL